jgi:hypothetical protein
VSQRAAPPLKTARFSVALAKCGRPAVHLTLVAPQKDPALRRLERESRVMTIHRARRGAGADYGVVGLEPAPGVQLLVFPRSLRRFAGKRIVGIDYDLLASDLHVTGRAALPRPKPSTRLRPPPKAAALFPQPASAAPSTAAAEEARPIPQPPSPPEVVRRLRATERLFRQKRYTAARDEIHRLAQDLAPGLEPAKRRSRH